MSDKCACGHVKGMHPFGLSEALMFNGHCMLCQCESFQADASPLVRTEPPCPQCAEMTAAADAFAAGEISSGKLAEMLRCSDKHGFKTMAHAFCEQEPSASLVRPERAEELIALNAAIAIAQRWYDAYPADVFGELPPPPAQGQRELASRDCIAAAAGRHMATRLIEELREAASLVGARAPQSDVKCRVSEIRGEEDNSGPLESTDLFVEGRGLSLLVNVEAGESFTYSLLVDGKLQQKGEVGARAPQEDRPLFWQHAIQECNEAHVTLDRLGAPKIKRVPRIRGEGDQNITFGLRDRILSLNVAAPPDHAPRVERTKQDQDQDLARGHTTEMREG